MEEKENAMPQKQRKKIVIGILAHVDAGKTTLSEALLYRSGKLRQLGRVDHRDTYLDTDPMERDRGITIFSKIARFSHKDTDFILLDTPGHTDFSAEAERTLWVLDYAILVISGRDGVQPHTQTLWRLLARHGIPTFLFVNKCDLITPGEQALADELSRKLSPACFPFFTKEGEKERKERTALLSEELLESYMANGEIDADLLADLVARREVFPCFFGSALKLIGIDGFLSALAVLTQTPQWESAFGARVYKIAHDDKRRLSFMKITGGALSVRDEIVHKNKNGELEKEKVTLLFLVSGTHYTPVDSVFAGEIAAVAGLAGTYAGEGLGEEPPGVPTLLEPVLTYRLVFPAGVDPKLVYPQLKPLEEEDPALSFAWQEEHGEIHARLMGEVQIEVLTRLIKERLRLDVSVDMGQILYKETIDNTVEGVGHFEPLRHYAEVHLLLEPLSAGRGLVFATRCSENQLAKNWQRLILTHLAEKEHRGVLIGAPLTDVKITLLCGRAHEKHTEGGDFREATYRAVRQGLMQAKNRLLEPYYRFTLALPTATLGRAMTDLERRFAEFTVSDSEGEESVLTGRVPVFELRDYAREVAAYTHGEGRLSVDFGGYGPCHNEADIVAAAGYRPENDTRNPSHSIFCAGGAGFPVPWHQVRSYMHIDSGFGKPGFFTVDSILPPPKKAKEAGVKEKELEAIMLKEFGPIRRKQYTEPKRIEAEKAAKDKSRGERLLVIDGYNLIFSWDMLNAIAQEDLDHARDMLMTLLSSYVAYTRCQLILVFDAYLVKGNPGKEELHDGYTVVYTAEGETADSHIQTLIRRFKKESDVRVVTSDSLIQLSALGAGVLRMSAREFTEELCRIGDEIREKLAEHAAPDGV